MMDSFYTVPVKSAKNVLTAASSRIKPAYLCETAGIDSTHLKNPLGRISLRQLAALYENASRLTQDHSFGLHVGEKTDLRSFDELGYMVMNSFTLGDALDRVAQYLPIWTDGATFRSHKDGPSARLVWTYTDRSIGECRHDCEMTLLVIAKIGRNLLRDRNWKPREVHFQHPAPRDITEHRRLFGAPVRFGMPANELICDRRTLPFRLSSPDLQLCNVLQRHADSLLTLRDSQLALVDRMKTMVRQAVLDRSSDVRTVSRRLGLGPRTLQRRLRVEGTTYQQLLGRIREELAKEYLREGHRSLGEIADLLGFAQPSEFHRAFRQWTGTTPGQYRSNRTLHQVLTH
ncbi:MAG TPA: AraC family transcriptional regulator [Candidatus Angelobacter sp.]